MQNKSFDLRQLIKMEWRNILPGKGFSGLLYSNLCLPTSGPFVTIEGKKNLTVWFSLDKFMGIFHNMISKYEICMINVVKTQIDQWRWLP